MDDQAVAERDEALYFAIAAAGMATLHGYRDWIEPELNDLLIKVESSGQHLEGVLGTTMKEHALTLRDISQTQWPNGVSALKKCLSELTNVHSGQSLTYDDPMEAIGELYQRLATLERIVRHVWACRTQVTALLSDLYPAPIDDDDQDDDVLADEGV